MANIVGDGRGGSDQRCPRPAGAARAGSGVFRRRPGVGRHRRHDDPAGRGSGRAGLGRRSADHRGLRGRRRGLSRAAAAQAVRGHLVGMGVAVAGRPGGGGGARAARQLALGVPWSGAVRGDRWGDAACRCCARWCRTVRRIGSPTRSSWCGRWPSPPVSRRSSRPASTRRAFSAGLAVLGLGAAGWGLWHLLPPGTFRVRPGVSAPIALRALLAGAMFGAEVTRAAGPVRPARVRCHRGRPAAHPGRRSAGPSGRGCRAAPTTAAARRYACGSSAAASRR